MKEVRIEIQNGKKGFTPALLDGVTLETERKGAPGKLNFSVLDDGKLDIEEGNPVRLIVDKVPMFYGYIFKITRDKSDKVSIMAYDQMRYLKNKDSYKFENTTANRIAGSIAKDYGIRTGELEETTYLIKSVVYDNKTLMDMIQDALEMTLTNTKKLYVLFDDAGKLTVRQCARMAVGLLVDSETAETYEYTSSIDEETYNRIVLVYEDKNKAKTYYIEEDKKTQQKWGTLQYYEKVDEKDHAANQAKMYLKLYNVPTKTLTVKNVLGDVRVRGGSVVMVKIKLGDTKVNRWMVVDSCKHTFKEGSHLMTLVLQGGEFVA